MNKYCGFAGRMYDELLAAESRLTGARQNFKQALIDAKQPTIAIFSETVFVPRRLMTERLSELEAANSVALKAALAKRAGGDDDDSDDTGDRDDDRDRGDNDGWEVGEDGKRRRKKSKKAKEPESGKPIDDEQHPPGENDTSPDRHPPSGSAYERAVKATAAAIIAAGAKARGITPKPSSQAAAIYTSNLRVIEAERAAGLPVRVTAQMIIDAGKRRRGEL